jgi:hypothetical protein
VSSDDELVAVVEAVRNDGAPRIVERDGEDIAVVVSPEEYRVAPGDKGRRSREALLSFAGIWRDIDADKLIEDIYRWRHESPPSDPAQF